MMRGSSFFGELEIKFQRNDHAIAEYRIPSAAQEGGRSVRSAIAVCRSVSEAVTKSVITIPRRRLESRSADDH